MTWDPSKIPVWLRRTPEQQAADDRLQNRLRQTYGPGLRLTPTERHLQRAVAVERSARAHLTHLVDAPGADPNHVRNAAAQLAEARAMQGHFNQASAIHPDERMAKRYAQIAEAIERPDDETCECEPERVTLPDGKTAVIQNENIDEMVFSRQHGKLVGLHRCKCGSLNAKPPGTVLQKRLDMANQKQREAQS